MSLNVYWASCENEWIFQKKPDSVITRINNYNNKTNDPNVIKMNGCPALINEFKNTYNIYSLYDFEFFIQNDKIFSRDLDKKFFDDHVNCRSIKNKLFSFGHKLIFFTDEESLEATLCISPYMEDNDVAKRCRLISGKIDIGKWFRITEFAFFLRDGFNSFKVKKDDVLYYIKFHTDERINFKQFVFSDSLMTYAYACSSLGKFIDKSPLYKLENYYKMFKHKKLILREIKNNLID